MPVNIVYKSNLRRIVQMALILIGFACTGCFERSFRDEDLCASTPVLKL